MGWYIHQECKLIVYTFMISRLDNCRVLFCMGKKTLHSMQRVKNNVTRLILRFGKTEHIIHVIFLYPLVSISLRVDYKVLP